MEMKKTWGKKAQEKARMELKSSKYPAKTKAMMMKYPKKEYPLKKKMKEEMEDY